MCINCTYYTKSKPICSEIFRHQLLLKDFTFTGIQCTCSRQYSLEYFGAESCRNIPFSCVFSAHVTPKAKQYSPRYFGTNSCRNIPFSRVLAAHTILKANQYSPKYFGTNRHRNIPFLCVLIACVTPKAEQYSPFRHQQAPKYSLFMCIHCVYYTKGRTIFSEIFRHQLLLKDFTFTRIQCTCSRQYSLEYFSAESCRNISFSHVLSAYIIPKANQ